MSKTVKQGLCAKSNIIIGYVYQIANIFSSSTAACLQCCGEVCGRSTSSWSCDGNTTRHTLATDQNSNNIQTVHFDACVCVYGAAPVYIRNMLTSVTELPGRSHLRSAASGLYDVPRTRTKFGTRSLSVAGPTAWNALPLELRATADCVFPEKNWKLFSSSRFMVLRFTLTEIKVVWPYCKFDIDLIVRRRWPCM